MKYFTLTLLLFSSLYLSAQTHKIGEPLLPLNPGRSVIFGKDIVIHDQPDRDQRNIAVCSAFNGWLYAIYSYDEEFFQDLSILRSVDNGITWEVLLEGGTGVSGAIVTRVDIIACGNNSADLKLFLGFSYYFPDIEVRDSHIWRANADPFIIEEDITDEPSQYVKDFCLASDYMYPSANSSPYSVGLLYSKAGEIGKDTLIFRSSSDGGITFDNRRVISISPNILHKVALSYGRSASFNSGRYFAAWEEQDNEYSEVGHIYTAHSEPNINSPFTTPVCLDMLDPGSANKARNPVISCQSSEADNDSSNISELVVFEKYMPGSNSYDLAGFYNWQATNSNYFRNFSVSYSSNYNLQPDLTFNPYNSTFMLTYFDSTDRMLPFLTHNVNMANPDSWELITSHYNDSTNIAQPNPKVRLNTLKQEGMNVWSADQPNGNGIAMFDAQYSTWTGVSDNNQAGSAKLLKAFPNPCRTAVTICFELQKAEKVSISLYNMIGQPEGVITDQNFSTGKHYVNYKVSNLPPGSYYYSFKAGVWNSNGKITVIK